jgi:hypothetical protein
MARDVVVGLCWHRGVDKLWGSAMVAHAPVPPGYGSILGPLYNLILNL